MIQRIRETLLTEKDNRNDLPVIRKDIEEFKDKFICGDNVEVLRQFPNDCIDLTITSPPYDNLRTYNGFTWDFEDIAKELYRVTKPGGVVVWVVGDATINGSETGSSFKQALFFMECGFNLHDTMIYAKNNPMPSQHNRYHSCFEYMFVLSKGKPKTFSPIMEKTVNPGGKLTITQREKDGSKNHGTGYGNKRNSIRYRHNIWKYNVGNNQTTKDKISFQHPAIFPEQLAADHIVSWSNPGDIVLDPFGGSGTTAKMSVLNDRHFIYIDCSQEYCDLARERIAKTTQDVVKGTCNAL
jgi:DNA modification methylase